MKTRLALCAFVLLASASIPFVSAQSSDMPPEGPFQTVHLINIPSADAEKAILGALVDINAAIAKGGCPKCVYHLWKIAGTQSGNYSHLWSSGWPGRDVYIKIHNSKEYQAAIEKHHELEAVMSSQVYNRYVELTPGK